jgi:curli production assembly/transport component CsgF
LISKAFLISTVASSLVVGNAMATEMVYTPINPSFGGNPANGSVLLGSSQATSKHKDTSGLGGSSSLMNQSPLQQFNDTLERSILSQLASSATSKVIGKDGKLIPGNVETGNFRISIIDLGNGSLRITTTDKTTGGSTSFEVGQ